MLAFLVCGFLTVCSITEYENRQICLFRLSFPVSVLSIEMKKKKEKKITRRGDLINQWLSQRSLFLILFFVCLFSCTLYFTLHVTFGILQ